MFLNIILSSTGTWREVFRRTQPKRLSSELKSQLGFYSFSDSEGFNLPLLEAMTAGIPPLFVTCQ